METRHTPGPWRLDEEAGVIGYRDVLSSSGDGIASTHGLHDDEEDLANARLIAAAPELLEALLAFRNASGGNFAGWNDKYALAIGKAEAAIAKATGAA